MKSSTARTTDSQGSRPVEHLRLYAGVIVVSVVVTAASALALWARPAAGQLGRAVRIGQLDVSTLTVAEATRTVQARLDDIERRGWVFTVDGRRVTVPPTVQPTDDPDVAYVLADVDVAATVQRAYAASRGWRLPWFGRPVVVPAAVRLNEEQVVAVLAANAAVAVPPVEAGFQRAADGTLTVTPPRPGRRFDRTQLFTALRQQLQNLEPPAVAVRVAEETPAVTAAEAATLLPAAERLYAALPLTLVHDADRWELDAATLGPHLAVVRQQDGQLALAVGGGFTDTFLADLARQVNRPAQAPRFALSDGRATLWQPPLDGRRLDVAATLDRLRGALNAPSAQSVELAVAVDPAPPLDGEGAALGIQELLGVGRSNFKGSPKNRRHNIRAGADSLNGLIIKPGEEFSLVQALGAIDATTGYLPELVIKGNRTVPEYGGGLCQIGTTTFRAALAAGLPIVERRNHSFRVRYYEPAGTDATIYDPKPDFRFSNDTGHAVLLQTKIEGDDLVFEFWGTRDGRVATQTTPRVFNVTPPPPKKVIETTDLKPGEEKCTEHAVNGADTEFTYTVTYPDGQVKEEVFKSHYRPWQEVCLVGVAALSTPPTDSTAPPTSGSEPPSSGDVTGIDAPAAATPQP